VRKSPISATQITLHLFRERILYLQHNEPYVFDTQRVLYFRHKRAIYFKRALRLWQKSEKEPYISDTKSPMSLTKAPCALARKRHISPTQRTLCLWQKSLVSFTKEPHISHEFVTILVRESYKCPHTLHLHLCTVLYRSQKSPTSLTQRAVNLRQKKKKALYLVRKRPMSYTKENSFSDPNIEYLRQKSPTSGAKEPYVMWCRRGLFLRHKEP